MAAGAAPVLSRNKSITEDDDGNAIAKKYYINFPTKKSQKMTRLLCAKKKLLLQRVVKPDTPCMLLDPQTETARAGELRTQFIPQKQF